MEKLDATNDRSLFHVRVRISQANIDGLLNVFRHAIEFKGAQRSECKTTNLLIRSFQVHKERINGQNRQLLVLLRIISQVEVYHLLHDHIVRSRRLHHLWIQTRHINAKRHIRNDFLDNVALLGGVTLETDGSEEESQLVDFALLVVDEELGHGQGAGGR